VDPFTFKLLISIAIVVIATIHGYGAAWLAIWMGEAMVAVLIGVGLVAGDRDLFGHGRPLTAILELSANFLRGEILYSDPWFLESDYALKLRLYGQSEQWYRYSVVETGFRPELSKQITKQLQASVFMQAKEVTTNNQGIDRARIGPTRAGARRPATRTW